MRAERITDSIANHGEGPVFSEIWGGLRWVDMLAGDVLSLGLDGLIGRRKVGEIAAAVRPRQAGGAVIAIERGFALEEPDGSLNCLEEVWSDRGLRMNEGGCDPDGRFYCGNMAYDRTPGAASIYRLAPDWTVDVVLEGVTISNGIEWSPDGTRVYYNDTETSQVAVFDYDSDQGLTNRRVFARIPDGGRPDGLTVDSEGGVWVALNGNGEVWRYSPDGMRDEVIEVDARQVTACTFGGPDLGQLFITTSREDLEEGEDPAAGSLFRAEPGVRGLRSGNSGADR